MLAFSKVTKTMYLITFGICKCVSSKCLTLFDNLFKNT